MTLAPTIPHRLCPVENTSVWHCLGDTVLVAVKPNTVSLGCVPQAFYRALRLVALDATVMDLPDTAANERIFGRRHLPELARVSKRRLPPF